MPPRARGPSPTAARILRAIHAGSRYGFDIMDMTGLASGTVYPALGRLERGGMVTAAWEDPVVSRESGRPARKYYALTSKGREALVAATAEALGRDEAAPGYSAG
jgi:PadR family transcriptional regulator